MIYSIIYQLLIEQNQAQKAQETINKALKYLSQSDIYDQKKIKMLLNIYLANTELKMKNPKKALSIITQKNND